MVTPTDIAANDALYTSRYLSGPQRSDKPSIKAIRRDLMALAF